MIGRLNHIAVVVPDLTAAAAVYGDTLGARVSAPQPLPAHGVTVVQDPGARPVLGARLGVQPAG